jgi:hypothetical protein
VWSASFLSFLPSWSGLTAPLLVVKLLEDRFASLQSSTMSPCGFLNFSSQSRSSLCHRGMPTVPLSSTPTFFRTCNQQQDERPSRKVKKENKVRSFPSLCPPFTVFAALQLSHKVAISLHAPRIDLEFSMADPYNPQISLTYPLICNPPPRCPYACSRFKTSYPRSIQTPVFNNNCNEHDCYSFNPKSTSVPPTTYRKTFACPCQDVTTHPRSTLCQATAKIPRSF